MSTPKNPLLGGRELQFFAKEDSKFSSLAHLTEDFDFKVLELLHSTRDYQRQRKYVLVTDDYSAEELAPITKFHDSINDLNEDVEENMVTIIHDYMMGFVDLEISATQQALNA